MLDINFVRNNLDLVRNKLEQRGFPLETLDRFNELDERRRALTRQRDDLNATRNRESQEIGKLMKEGRKDEAESRRLAVRELGDRIAAASSLSRCSITTRTSRAAPQRTAWRLRI